MQTAICAMLLPILLLPLVAGDIFLPRGDQGPPGMQPVAQHSVDEPTASCASHKCPMGERCVMVTVMPCDTYPCHAAPTCVQPCSSTENWQQCKPCEMTCSGLIQGSDCGTSCSRGSGCVCRAGHLRSPTGECVPAKQCAGNTSISQVSATDVVLMEIDARQAASQQTLIDILSHKNEALLREEVRKRVLQEDKAAVQASLEKKPADVDFAVDDLTSTVEKTDKGFKTLDHEMIMKKKQQKRQEKKVNDVEAKKKTRQLQKRLQHRQGRKEEKREEKPKKTTRQQRRATSTTGRPNTTTKKTHTEQAKMETTTVPTPTTVTPSFTAFTETTAWSASTPVVEKREEEKERKKEKEEKKEAKEEKKDVVNAEEKAGDKNSDEKKDTKVDREQKTEKKHVVDTDAATPLTMELVARMKVESDADHPENKETLTLMTEPKTEKKEEETTTVAVSTVKTDEETTTTAAAVSELVAHRATREDNSTAAPAETDAGNATVAVLLSMRENITVNGAAVNETEDAWTIPADMLHLHNKVTETATTTAATTTTTESLIAETTTPRVSTTRPAPPQRLHHIQQNRASFRRPQQAQRRQPHNRQLVPVAPVVQHRHTQRQHRQRAPVQNSFQQRQIFRQRFQSRRVVQQKMPRRQQHRHTATTTTAPRHWRRQPTQRQQRQRQFRQRVQQQPSTTPVSVMAGRRGLSERERAALLDKVLAGERDREAYVKMLEKRVSELESLHNHTPATHH